MKAKNNYNRSHKPIKGSEKATAPRSHAHPNAESETGGNKDRPKRNDIIRRHMLSTRKDPNQ
jgi:hypothetical protein